MYNKSETTNSLPSERVFFKEPSELMANQINVGLKAPSKYPLLIAVVLFALGGALLLTALGYFLWRRRNPETVSMSYNDRP